MNTLLLSLCLALAAAAEPEITKEPIVKKPAPASTSDSATQDPVEQLYQKILEQDEKALREIERLIEEADKFAELGAPAPRSTMLAKIDALIEPVRKSYDDFLHANPKHVNGRIAYGSFLQEIGETDQAIVQLEKARELDPKNPTPWNNLANIFGHIGPLKKALQYYEKAIELDPTEPVYLQNLATSVYLFRKDAMEMYRINETEVFNKSLDLYRQALKLEPNNFLLATDLAMSYYGIKPLRTQEALDAWNDALKIAKGNLEKEGVYLHLARVEMNSGLFDEARKHLDLVTHPELEELKTRLERNWREKSAKARGEPADSNPPSASADAPK